MIIERNPAKEAILLDALKASFEIDDKAREGDGIHMSSLMSVRQSYFQSIIPLPIDETRIGYFASGRAIEDVVARMAGVEGGAVAANQVRVPGLIAGERRYFHGVSYRPDFRWDGAPIEFKSRRADLAKPGEEAGKYDHYLEQLRSYCTADNVTLGGLWLFDIGGGCTPALGHRDYYTRPPSFAFYDVTYREEELQAYESVLLSKQEMLVAAKKKGGIKDGASLPLCAPWMCGKQKKDVTVPSKCAIKDCEVRHRTAKAPHIMSPEVAEWHYIPRCPYYAFCRPELIDASRGAR